ncbi:MAG: M50 family metallopeptidase [Ignavibacteriaceae bacterium]
MKHKHISIGNFLGIPIYLDYSWFLILALLTWMLAQSYFPLEFKNWTNFSYWLVSFITSIFFFLSILLHEFGHSIIAIKYKIKVKRITLFLFGGVAEISKEPSKSSADFWIAVAGPITSFILAAVFYLLAKAFGHNQYIVASFKYLAFINFILAIFNLIPGFPLDGGRILRAIVWAITKNYKQATTIAANAGRFFGFLFIMIGVFQIFHNNISDGLWIVFIGWFLEIAAMSRIQRQALNGLLLGHQVHEALSNDYGIVYPDSTVQEIIDNHFIGANRRNLLVKDNNIMVGFLTPGRINSISIKDRQNKTVKDIMIPLQEINKINSTEPLLDAIKSINENDVRVVPVIENGNCIGILNHTSITQFIFELQKLGALKR